MAGDLVIDGVRSIPVAEIEISSALAGGPGGQHVNKTESKIEVRWRPATTAMALSLDQRARLMARLSSRLTSDGVLIVTSSEERSQQRNRERALGKLAALVREALVPPVPRRATKPSRSAKRRRLESKRHVGEKKRLRQKPE
ncbi:MAG TPA: alternative ribosome rescue aminoacyl-tRNA hydrolase ArfB [bacterium]|nr:alternative ribosome rescue aminoacyl-tRNA hydrolase ArfB [bacterium]